MELISRQLDHALFLECATASTAQDIPGTPVIWQLNPKGVSRMKERPTHAGGNLIDVDAISVLSALSSNECLPPDAYKQVLINGLTLGGTSAYTGMNIGHGLRFIHTGDQQRSRYD